MRTNTVTVTLAVPCNAEFLERKALFCEGPAFQLPVWIYDLPGGACVQGGQGARSTC